MNERENLENLLKLLMTMASDVGYTAEELAEKFETTQRAIQKDIQLFRDAGFIVSTSGDKYRIDSQSPYFRDISKLLHFSEEEAHILGKAIHSIDNVNIIKDNLIKKLYSLYDFDRVAETIVHSENSENVSNLTKAIKEQKQVELIGYQSANSAQTSNRIVEAFDFSSNYISVWCYELASGKVKLFKTSRIGEVKVLDQAWTKPEKHRKQPMDVFRISSETQVPVKLELNLRAYQLLVEEYPLAEKNIKQIEANKYIFESNVSSFNGVGRFVLGLMDDIDVISPVEFKNYLNDKISEKKF